MKNKVLILTGPGGSGKSTVAKLLYRNHGFSLINGDELDTEFFPHGGQRLPENLSNLKKAHLKILAEASRKFNEGRNVVVEYIIFGDYLNFFNIFKNEFGDNLEVKVLFPEEKENIKRDAERKCWTTGVEKIISVRRELVAIRGNIGEENFIDTSNQSPEETAIKILK